MLFFAACSTTTKKKDITEPAAAEKIGTETVASAERDDTSEPEKTEELKPLKNDPPPLKKKDKRKRGRFNFSGDEFIKETGVNPFDKRTDTIMRLTGHARVQSKNLKMNSPHIEIYGDDGYMAYARGPVEIFDTKSATRITGDEALFIRAENRAIIRGHAKLVTYTKSKDKKKKKEKVTINSNELERNFDTSISWARGNVVATTSNSVLYSETAEYDEPNDLIRSDTHPRIFTQTDVFLADKIESNVVKNISEFQGNVKAYFSREDDKDRKKKKKTQSAVRSEEGTLIQDEKLPFGQKLTLRKKVAFEREKYSGYSEEADIYGSGAEWVKARDQVVLINREENSKSWGDNFEWVKATGYLFLGANPGVRTKTLLFNKMNKPSVEIRASTLTRATEKSRPQARGKVNIFQFPKDTAAEPTKMGSEWAEIFREEKIIEMHGSPYVIGSMGRVNAREIILYYAEERYEMLGIMPGVIDGARADGE